MHKAITSLSLIIGSAAAFGQFPLAESFLLNTDGQTANYEYYPGPPPTTESVSLDDSVNCTRICYDDDYVYVRTLNLADYTMGPWEMNPNEPSAQESQYRITRNPVEETGTKTEQPTVGALGIAVNGIKLYGTGDGRSYDASSNENSNSGDGVWNGDAWTSEGPTMDATGAGHADSFGTYHYHATPIALFVDPSTEHSPIIGWAFDGFPIYGPYGYDSPTDAGSSVVRIESSYQLRSISNRTTLPDGSASVPPGPSDFSTFPLGTYWEDYEFIDASGHLDEYNGRFCYTPEYPSGIYAYFVTMDASGTPAFPYLVGPEYYGEVNSPEIGGPAGNITFPSSSEMTCLDGTSGITETKNVELSVYPNPATSVLTVEGIENGLYEIYDALGRQVISGENQAEINISTLAPGTYTIRLFNDQLSATTQFMKR